MKKPSNKDVLIQANKDINNPKTPSKDKRIDTTSLEGRIFPKNNEITMVMFFLSRFQNSTQMKLLLEGNLNLNLMRLRLAILEEEQRG